MKTNQTLNDPANTIAIDISNAKMQYSLVQTKREAELAEYAFRLKFQNETIPEPVEISWKIPAINVKGMWRPTSDFSKHIVPDWELENHESRISIDAPVISLFGNNDDNVVCFSCSNAVNRIELAAKYREEDNHFYCSIILFTECKYPIKDFEIDIRIDSRNIHFSRALMDTSKWWETYSDLKPIEVPSIAKQPLYSTWYQFHQDLDKERLLKECCLAKEIGFKSIILDDGWQTNDNNRGYDYTGDWQPDRFPDFKNIITEIQSLGMKVGIWYSVPFCGKKSEAYQRFKGKFLTENHRWAPVFDPRYPEVREYLIGVYATAVRDWRLDGLKLDFIDDFKSYPETSFEQDENRDYRSINRAVERLLGDVITEVKKINPEIFIEFRQKYTGPAIRKFGNMLRAFDCPGDYTMNRVRITDIKMLAGNTAVHADMVKWNFNEAVEDAALHYISALFGVPQISIMLHQAPKSHLRMVEFYTQYWNANSKLFTTGKFYPISPMTNYPVLMSEKGSKIIIGVFEDFIVKLDKKYAKIDILNAKLTTSLVIQLGIHFGKYECKIYSGEGTLVKQSVLEFTKGISALEAPKSGMVQLKQID